jgi:hypothetical protein
MMRTKRFSLSEHVFCICIAGLLTDLFRIAANHLAFSDLMMIFFGQPSSLERLREPLGEFISQSLLNGNLPSDTNIDAAVERVIQDMRPDISSVAVCRVCLAILCFILIIKIHV